MKSESGCYDGCNWVYRFNGRYTLFLSSRKVTFVALRPPTTFNNTRGAAARRSLRAGLTLLELVTVIAILAIVAGFIVPTAAFLRKKGQFTAAQASLTTIRDAIMGTQDKPGFYLDTGRLPNNIAELFIQPSDLQAFNRDTGLGWRGPYLISAGGTYPDPTSAKAIQQGFLQYIAPSGSYPGNGYGSKGDPAVLDPWGNPIIIQFPYNTSHPTTGAQDYQFARLISAGPNGVIDTSPTATYLNPVSSLYDPYAQQSARGDDIVLYINHSDSDP